MAVIMVDVVVEKEEMHKIEVTIIDLDYLYSIQLMDMVSVTSEEGLPTTPTATQVQVAVEQADVEKLALLGKLVTVVQDLE
jgi:hypothetical protein